MLKDHLMNEERILAISSGEVKKTATVEYDTGAPAKKGLYDPAIFKMTGFNTISEKGELVSAEHKYMDRFGHIVLAAPVVNRFAWYDLAETTGLTPGDLERVVYFSKYLMVDPGDSGTEKGQVFSEKEVLEMRQDKKRFRAMMGAEAVLRLLGKESPNAAMIMTVLPVAPVSIRPMFLVEGTGKYAVSDLNDLYRKVLNRNSRISALNKIDAPEIIMRNEKRMLQEAVDALFMNGRRGRPVTDADGRPYVSIADYLEKKNEDPHRADLILKSACIDLS